MKSSRLHIAAILVLTLAVVRCKEIRVQWTIEGVGRNNSIEVELGDLLVLECVPGESSNVVHNPNVTQFERCNNTEEIPLKVGECLGSFFEIDLEIKRSSTNVASAISYEPGSTQYFTSYSNGTISSTLNSEPRSGGQCSQGLKLAVFVKPMATEEPPTMNVTTVSTEGTTTKPTTTEKPTDRPTEKPTETETPKLPDIGGQTDGCRSVHTTAWLHVLLVTCTLLTIAALRH